MVASQEAVEVALPFASLLLLASSFLTIRTSTPHTPRRAPILTLDALLAVSYFATGIAVVVETVISRRWGSGAQVACAYALAGNALWAAVGITSEWKREWDKWWIKGIVLLSLAGEGALLGLKIKAATVGRTSPFDIIALSFTAARVLLLLPLLVVLWLPRPLSDGKLSTSAPLLGESNEHATGASTPAYGTFNGSAATSSAPSTTQSDSKKPAEEQQTWGGFFGRLYSLGLVDRLWPRNSARLQLCILTCCLIVLAARGVNGLAPLSLGKVIDRLTDGHSPWTALLVYVSLRFLSGSGGLSALQSLIWTPIEQYSDARMQQLCFDHLLNLSLAWQTKRKTGETLRTIDRGFALTNLLQIILFNFTPILLDISVALVIFFVKFGSSLSLVVLVVMVAYIGVSVKMTSWRTAMRKQMNERDSATRAIITDVLMSWETVKYFTAEGRESERYRQAVSEYQVMEWKVTMSLSLLNFSQNAIMTTGLLFGSAIVAHDVVQGRSKPSDFVVYLTFMQQLYSPLGFLGGLYRQLNQLVVDSEKLLKLLAEEPDIKDDVNADVLHVTDGEIVFDDVHFRYDERLQALKGVSFTVPKGSSVALVGETGSGKSTILRLLLRFYEIQGGSISIDGKDISHVTQKSLRQAIGVVPQETTLLNESIGFNVNYGREGATQAEVEDVCRAAQLHDKIVSWPEGYDTRVGERGIRLSGGEKQRVSLARAMLKSPPILLLDEATSALDTATEREIQAALDKLQRGRTSLTIAHRLSTIVNVDKIIVLSKGEIVEQGSFEELVARRGAFATLWQKQITTEAEQLALAKQEAAAGARAQTD